jgi:hypothetical protein
MDLSFLLANLISTAVKSLWFSKDTRARDIVLPLLTLLVNFLTQLAIALGVSGESLAPAQLASSTLVATGLSLGTHRGFRWLGALKGGK